MTVKMPRFKTKSSRLCGDCTTNDCYSIAYYLYCLSETEEIYLEEDIIKLFQKLAKQLKMTDRINTFTKECVLAAQKKKILTPAPEEMRHFFSTSSVKSEYNEDGGIDAILSLKRLKVDKNLVNLFRCFYAERNASKFFSRLIANFLLKKEPSKKMTLLEKIPPHIKEALNDMSSIDFFAGSLPLSDLERRYLVFLYRCSALSVLDQFFENLSVETIVEFRKKALGMDNTAYNSLINENGNLRMFGFIDENGNIQEEALRCIANKNLDIFFADLVKNTDCSEAYDIESFNVNKETNMIIQRMLSGNENISILLYGKAGSGKSEYAKSLVKASGLKPLIFKNEAEISINNYMNEDLSCRLNLLLSIARPDSVIIIDEADTLLETSTINFMGKHTAVPKKGIVNKMLENSRNKIIWIVNHKSQIDISTLRRFNFSHKFEAMSKEQLRNITRSKLSPLGLSSNISSQILDLIEKYSITGASVENVAKTIRSLGTENQTELLACIQTILKENSILINGTPKKRRKTSPAYDMNALNTSLPPETIVEMIQNAETFSKKNLCGESGIRMLFYGLSGTGKTEFARYISEKLGKKLLIKRASDLLDMYVGNSEKNIRDAFEEADHTGSILLLDEADSFFANRENAQHSWERTQVNELLTQMEDFNGIFICTTNLRKILDPAMNRRFHIIVEFKPMTKEGIRCMMSRYFKSFEFTDDEIRRLERCSSVTPGDFGILSQTIRFMNQSKIDHSFIVEELCRLQNEKKNEEHKHKVGYIE